MTPLMCAVKAGWLDVARDLIYDHHADVNAQSFVSRNECHVLLLPLVLLTFCQLQYKYTPLMLAARFGQAMIVRELLKNERVDPHLRNHVRSAFMFVHYTFCFTGIFFFSSDGNDGVPD